MRIVDSVLYRFPAVKELKRQIDEQGGFPAGHFYSPIPAKSDVESGLKLAKQVDAFPDIDLRTSEQAQLIQEFGDYYPEVPFLEELNPDQGRYYYNQTWYCYSDAIMLYCMIRKYAFKRIVEVGSGYSSAAMLDSLESLGRKDCQFTFIEPYPKRLKSLIDIDGSADVTLYEREVQSVNPDVFSELDSGDLLFIDSSHIVKYRSDLHYLMFNVLPILPTGVFVHFHDIFFPFEYPDAWLQEGRYWNECYFLRAFLAGNKDWKIVMFNDYVNKALGDLISRTMPLCRKNFGGSLYLQKVG